MLIQWMHAHVGKGGGLEIDFCIRTYLMNAALLNTRKKNYFQDIKINIKRNLFFSNFLKSALIQNINSQ
jgi:hypothetical protein